MKLSYSRTFLRIIAVCYCLFLALLSLPILTHFDGFSVDRTIDKLFIGAILFFAGLMIYRKNSLGPYVLAYAAFLSMALQVLPMFSKSSINLGYAGGVLFGGALPMLLSAILIREDQKTEFYSKCEPTAWRIRLWLATFQLGLLLILVCFAIVPTPWETVSETVERVTKISSYRTTTTDDFGVAVACAFIFSFLLVFVTSLTKSERVFTVALLFMVLSGLLLATSGGMSLDVPQTAIIEGHLNIVLGALILTAWPPGANLKNKLFVENVSTILAALLLILLLSMVTGPRPEPTRSESMQRKERSDVSRTDSRDRPMRRVLELKLNVLSETSVLNVPSGY